MGPSEIPADVWIHVMHHLEDEYVRDRANRLHEISSLFLQVSLDRRYRALELTDVKQRSLTMLEERLKDPAIARRVRSLSLEPHYPTAYGQDVPPEGAAPAMAFLRGLDRGHRVRRREPDAEDVHPTITFGAWQQAIRRIIPLLSCLRTVILRTDTMDTQFDIQPLIRCAWQSSCSRVARLHLRGTLAGYTKMLQENPQLPFLQELKLAFVDSAGPSSLSPPPQIASFVNDHASQIHTMGLHFCMRLNRCDITPLFNALSPFPTLNTFIFDTLNAKAIVPDTSGLLRLLGSPAMRTVYLGSITAATCWGPPMIPDADAVFAAFVDHLVDEGVALKHLHTLDTWVPTSQDGVQTLWRLLAYVAPTVTALRLRGHDVDTRELREMASELAGANHITTLTMDVRTLRPEFFNIICAGFPGLQKLTLHVRDMIVDPIAFHSQMEGRNYENWKLKLLDIRNGLEASNVAELKRIMPHTTVVALGTP